MIKSYRLYLVSFFQKLKVINKLYFRLKKIFFSDKQLSSKKIFSIDNSKIIENKKRKAEKEKEVKCNFEEKKRINFVS
jgi:hypothetical protein